MIPMRKFIDSSKDKLYTEEQRSIKMVRMASKHIKTDIKHRTRTNKITDLDDREAGYIDIIGEDEPKHIMLRHNVPHKADSKKKNGTHFAVDDTVSKVHWLIGQFI